MKTLVHYWLATMALGALAMLVVLIGGLVLEANYEPLFVAIMVVAAAVFGFGLVQHWRGKIPVFSVGDWNFF